MDRVKFMDKGLLLLFLYVMTRLVNNEITMIAKKEI